MAVSRLIAQFLPGAVLRFAERLRFPHLFLGTLALFLIDLVLPDFIPFVDEILLGLATLMVAAFRKRKSEPKEPRP
ncbi:DUF6116 family protein [Niveibacterium sp. SC-1]|uniref:DUF6116 family protein n=1 Tax=Niveibacterium sp. SC-1 TaxID=3135646 RepID=UPI00311D88C6